MDEQHTYNALPIVQPSLPRTLTPSLSSLVRAALHGRLMAANPQGHQKEHDYAVKVGDLQSPRGERGVRHMTMIGLRQKAQREHVYLQYAAFGITANYHPSRYCCAV